MCDNLIIKKKLLQLLQMLNMREILDSATF